MAEEQQEEKKEPGIIGKLLRSVNFWVYIFLFSFIIICWILKSKKVWDSHIPWIITLIVIIAFSVFTIIFHIKKDKKEGELQRESQDILMDITEGAKRKCKEFIKLQFKMEKGIFLDTRKASIEALMPEGEERDTKLVYRICCPDKDSKEICYGACLVSNTEIHFIALNMDNEEFQNKISKLAGRFRGFERKTLRYSPDIVTGQPVLREQVIEPDKPQIVFQKPAEEPLGAGN